MSVSRRSQRMSGCRRRMPDAVHGTSTRMRSKRRAVPPAVRASRRRRRRSVAVSPSRSRLSRDAREPAGVDVERDEIERRRVRAGGRSCRPARRTRPARACRRRRRAAAPRAAPPRPAPTPRPSAKPGMRVTGSGRSKRTAVVADRARRDAFGCRRAQIVVARRAAPVDAHDQRRRFSDDDRRSAPSLGIRRPQARDPPASAARSARCRARARRDSASRSAAGSSCSRRSSVRSTALTKPLPRASSTVPTTPHAPPGRRA